LCHLNMQQVPNNPTVAVTTCIVASCAQQQERHSSSKHMCCRRYFRTGPPLHFPKTHNCNMSHREHPISKPQHNTQAGGFGRTGQRVPYTLKHQQRTHQTAAWCLGRKQPFRMHPHQAQQATVAAMRVSIHTKLTATTAPHTS
jgi:hypothetical protein